MDVNVDDYSVPELMSILGVSTLSEMDIEGASEMIKSSLKKKTPEKLDFIEKVKTRLLEETKSINKNYAVSVKQDKLNPTLKNTITRFINLDSQFRQYSNETLTTNYTCDLSDTLKNTLNLTLYSYQIPFAWYVIDESYGNDRFWVIFGENKIPIIVKSGNYSQIEFQKALTIAFVNAGFVNVSVEYNSNNGYLTLFMYGALYNDVRLDTDCVLLFYDFNDLDSVVSYLNDSLGWIMGFRVDMVSVLESGNVGSAMLDLTGTKYLILSVDDYNQNHVNNSLVSITQQSQTIKMPLYYSPDIPTICVGGRTNNGQTPGITNNGLLLANKHTKDLKPTTIALPSAPRTLTNAQLYTINAIQSNNQNINNFLVKAPTTADILAILPVKTSVGINTGTLLVEFSGSLQDNTRSYFGPVNIERMCVKLLDDKGRIVNLHGQDWCVTLIAELLYQY